MEIKHAKLTKYTRDELDDGEIYMSDRSNLYLVCGAHMVCLNKNTVTYSDMIDKYVKFVQVNAHIVIED